MTELTTAQIDKLLNFRGYGNPNGRFWFVGMEEGGSSNLEELRIRADKFDPLADLAESHLNFPAHDMNRLSTSTWGLMSSIAGRLSHAPDWWDTEYRRKYQSTKLGRKKGETYLTELLPLPKKSIGDWPYGRLFSSPQDYFEKRYPVQLESLRAEYGSANPKPEFIFCYGKMYWERHREVFDFIDFQPALDEKVQWGQDKDTVFVLTKFFGWRGFGFSKNFVDNLCEFALGKSQR